jgi:hypothetical protein
MGSFNAILENDHYGQMKLMMLCRSFDWPFNLINISLFLGNLLAWLGSAVFLGNRYDTFYKYIWGGIETKFIVCLLIERIFLFFRI